MRCNPKDCTNPNGCDCVPHKSMNNLSDVLNQAVDESFNSNDPPVDWEDFGPQLGGGVANKCECGGDASGVGTHAHYCPKHEK